MTITIRRSFLISSLLTLDGVLADVTSAFISAATAHGVGATLNLGGTIATTEAGVAASTSTSILDPAITTAPAGDLSTVTIDGSPGYEVAANCVKNCLFEEFEGTPDGLYLPIAIGCASPYYNGCYCTQAVASEASSFMSVCVKSVCLGTSLLPGALSIYDNYCTSAGYPRNVVAVTTVTGAGAGNPGTTAVTSDALTLTLLSTTQTYIGGILQTGSSGSTPTNPSSSSPNTTSSNSGPKTNVAAIVGGILGALVLIAILLGIFLVWLPRRQKAKERLQAQGGPVGGEGSTFVPPAATGGGAAAAVVGAGVGGRKGGGRAELPDEGKGVGVVGGAEKEKVNVMSEVVSPVSPESGKVEMDAQAQGQGRYGLRPEELDSEGRYVGELHGDGRRFGGVELEGSGVLR